MSDLYWDRMEAGHYETTYFTNKYRYKIIGEGIEWECYYMFYTKFQKNRRWRLFLHTDRLKGAKNKCWEHNQNPRTTWKLVGRKEESYNKGKFKIVWAEQVPKAGYPGEFVLKQFTKRSRPLPEFYDSYSGEVTYLGEDYFNNDNVVERLANEYSVAVANRSA